ncbi:MAG: hypothetical protein LBT87_03580 [Treponema sp.]|nr:hypothetical protein [Treponema sp.]
MKIMIPTVSRKDEKKYRFLTDFLLKPQAALSMVTEPGEQAIPHRKAGQAYPFLFFKNKKNNLYCISYGFVFRIFIGHL